MFHIKIEQANIYGFGKWIDYSIDFSTESFNCIYGENESGKSTLQNFILFMLFGFPPKQREFYRPKTSGKMGGRLTITDSEVGEYVIERMDDVKNGAATCYTHDGKEYDESWLKKQLNGMTAEIYKSIYAFSALDLKDFKQMKDDDLGKVILGIGLTGSTNIYSLEKDLDNKLTELFRPSGRKPLINQQFESLDKLNTELIDYKNNEATYREKQTELVDINTEIEQLSSNLQLEKEHHITTERQLHNIQAIYDYHTYHQQSEQTDNEILFPESGIERLEELKRKILPMQSELSVFSSILEKNKLEQSKTTEKLANQKRYETAREIEKEYQHYKLDDHSYSEKKEKVSVLSVRMEEELRELNSGLTTDLIAQLSLPFYIEKTWNDLKNKKEIYQIEQNQIENERNTLEKQQIFLENQYKELQEKHLTNEQLEGFYQQIDMYNEFKYHKKISEQSFKQQTNWKALKQKKNKNLNTILAGCALIGILFGILGLTFDNSLLFNFMVILFVVGLGQWVWGRQSIKETTRLLINDKSNGDNPLNVVTEEEKEDAEKALMLDDETKNQLALIKKQLASIDIQFIKWTEKNTGLIYQDKRLTEEINEQINLYPFLSEIEITHWPELYQAIKQLIELERNKETTHSEAERLKESLVYFESKVKAFLLKESKYEESHPIELQLNTIETIIEECIQLNNKAKQNEEEANRLTRDKSNLEQEMQVYVFEMNKLFNAACVENEDEFYEQAKKKEAKQLIQQNKQKTLNQLESIFVASDLEKLINERPNQSVLERSQQDSITLIKKYETELDTKRQQLADLNADLNKMESSESYSNTMHSFMMKKEELNTLANEWAVLKVAKEMLIETKRQYRDKYLTKVIDRTSFFFNHVTEEKYLRVIPPLEGNSFKVETEDQMRYDVFELSQGTIDQLYICLRLAISEIMSETHHVPFIIDDAFVHFDDLRAKRMIDMLIKISDRQQVIFFTCREQIIKKVKSNDVTKLK